MEGFLEKTGVSPLSDDEITMMSPIKLAYLGDAVYEVLIREYLINSYKGKVNKLNKKAVFYVNASAQGYAARNIKEFLSNKEWRLIKRGRNQKSNVPRNANVSDYKYATGFEALIGYLYLNNNRERIYSIVKEAIRLIDSRSSDE